VLQGTGRISHKQAIKKAEKEFEIYREREMKQLESDFDRAVKELARLNPPHKENGNGKNWRQRKNHAESCNISVLRQNTIGL
jgi:hypothetical protein